jgi:hypothetical protein
MLGLLSASAASAAVATEDAAASLAGAPRNSQRYYYFTWKSAQGNCTPLVHDDWCPVSWLWAGRNYFYCQVQQPAHAWREGNSVNNWWLWTGLDTGGQGWISAVYVSVGGDWERIPGLPDCVF